jgi:hypothetical protein
VEFVRRPPSVAHRLIFLAQTRKDAETGTHGDAENNQQFSASPRHPISAWGGRSEHVEIRHPETRLDLFHPLQCRVESVATELFRFDLFELCG